MKTLYKLLLVLVVSLCSINQLSAQSFPAGFQAIQIATGINSTDMKFSPDGQYLFVTDKGGKVFLVENDVLLTTPILNISGVINTDGERGLTHVAVDPQFATNHYVYLYYTVNAAGNNKFNRVSRFTFNTVSKTLSGETILINLDLMTGSIHVGGALNFGIDGKLYITTGETSNPVFSQSFSSLLGKVLRINKDGTIPTDNPFYNVLTGNYRLIYARGMRNPFSADIHPVTGRYFVGDVGQDTWEEINDIKAGRNYGWSTVEGMIQAGTTPPADYEDPIRVYDHDEGCAIVGAAFYAPAQVAFPQQYINKFFYSDYCNNAIRMIDPDTLANAPVIFATGLNRPVTFAVKPSGEFYYLERSGSPFETQTTNGALWKVVYTGSLEPVIGAHPQPQIVTVGDSANFTVVANGLDLSYQWLRGGADIPGANQPLLTLHNLQLSDSGALFSCRVTNDHGTVTSNQAMLKVTTRQPPTPVITLPTEGTTYVANSTLNYSGSATDAVEGPLGVDRLTWKIDFHHDTHFHPGLDPTSGVAGGSYLIPANIEVSDTVWYRIYLTATNELGLKKTVYREVYPQKVTLHIRSLTAGRSVAIPVNMDGTITPPQVDKPSVKGVIRNITAQATYVLADTLFTFIGWGNGNTNPALTITTPNADTTITAIYEKTATYTGAGLTAEYRNGDNFNGAAGLVRVDPTVDFSWTGSPATGFGTDNWTVRWDGYVQPRTSGLYTFYVANKVSYTRLYIENLTTPKINRWPPTQPVEEETYDMVLTAGTKYRVRLEFWANYGNAANPSTVSLKWSGPNVLKQIVPMSSMFTLESALPVLFTSFTVKPRDGQLLLNWEVEDLGNVKGYAIERRKAGSAAFETLAFVNTTGSKKYNFTDAAITVNALYEYRIRQEDLDGRNTYSPIRMGRLSGHTNFDYTILPNPVREGKQVQLLFTQSIGKAEVQLVSPGGKLLLQKRVTSSGQTYNLPLTEIPSGAYYIKVIQDDNVVVKKLLIQ